MTKTTHHCPNCKSTDPHVCASNCYNPWHLGLVVHLQREPIGTPGAECHAACSAVIDDAPSELAINQAFVSCPACLVVGFSRKADEILPWLGGLVRQAHLVPVQPTSKTIDTDDNWKGSATIIKAPLNDASRIYREFTVKSVDQPSAEMFQDMLRVAYQAGALSAQSGETFEDWYQREVLR